MASSGGQRIGVYPGTFDPITLGHADIIRRGAKLVDRLIIGVTTNISKDPMFLPEERMAMVRREVAAMDALGAENQFGKRQREQGRDFIARPVGARR